MRSRDVVAATMPPPHLNALRRTQNNVLRILQEVIQRLHALRVRELEDVPQEPVQLQPPRVEELGVELGGPQPEHLYV